MKLSPHAIFLLAFAVPACAAVTDLGKWNCTACHAASETQAAWLLPYGAPRLSEAGGRMSPDWLRKFLAAPHETTPGTMMPDVLHGDAEKIDALTHYLTSLGQAKFRRVRPDKAAVARGETLYHRIGCVACHPPLNGADSSGNSVPLPPAEEKWAFEGLRRYLLDPIATRPSGRMPSMHLPGTEAADIAHYLLRKSKVPAAVEVTFYRGRIRSLEDLNSAEVARTLPAAGVTLEGPMKDRGAALRISTWLKVEREGDYTFFMNAGGAGRFSIDGKWVIGAESWEAGKVDGKHALHLGVGGHEVKLDYVQRGRLEPSLALEWEGPGIARGAIPSSNLSSEREPVTDSPPFIVDAAKAEKGRGFYTTLGCATCHEPKRPSEELPALTALNPARGCLAGTLPASVPDFHFQPAQRNALRSALAELKNPALAAPTPMEQVAETMASFRCTACHVREGKGGVSEDRGPFFTSNVDDLGDEGRLPPNLDGVGDKLRPDWLARVLAEGASVRPYLNTRMPIFGTANIGHLTELFVALDRHSTPLTPTNDSPEVQRDTGRKLVGTDGLSCIACHRFNRQPAHMLQVVDLLTTTERLNEDWFRRFLRDPNRFHPGTRMPPFWPGGRSIIPSLLDGDTDRQHAALWSYFSDGQQAKFPEGLSRQNMEIVVGGEAVVYRGKLWEAGFRAIALGYPGQLNAAFDAEEMRLALLWRGRFLNAGAHWNSQGMGQIRPLGTNVIVFPHGSPFAALTSADAPWPAESSKALGMKFRGYHIDALHRATMLYEFGSLAVEDFISPAPSDGKPALQRILKLSGPTPAGLHLRLAVGKCSRQAASAWRVNDAISVKVAGSGPPLVRGTGDKQEILVPIRTLDGMAELEVDYVW